MSDIPATAAEKQRRAAIVQQRGAAELRDLAADLHARHRPPAEILVALHERAQLLALASRYRLHSCLDIVRELPGVGGWNPYVESERVESDWRGRAEALADFLIRHAGSVLAERLVQTAESLLVNDLEEWSSGVVARQRPGRVVKP